MGDNTENILINLKVLSKLQCHARLDTTETLFRIHTPASWVPSWVKRWYAAQNRVTDISRIRNMYMKALELAEDNERVREYLKASLDGLINLKTTYENDVTTVALIDVIVDNVNVVIRQHNDSMNV